MKMQKMFVANWKMHGDGARLSSWAAQFCPPPDCRIVLCPPVPYLAAARRLLPPSVAIGAQSVSAHLSAGAHTGEISARMLADVGCEYVLIGHSERRAAGETDADCAAQLVAAVAAGLLPLLCVGESADDYAAGRAESVIARQVEVLAAVAQDLPLCVLAYEPVWAIGSGKTPSSAELARIGEYSRRLILEITTFKGKISVLYGGSIKKDNAFFCWGAREWTAVWWGAHLWMRRFLLIFAEQAVVNL